MSRGCHLWTEVQLFSSPLLGSELGNVKPFTWRKHYNQLFPQFLAFGHFLRIYISLIFVTFLAVQSMNAKAERALFVIVNDTADALIEDGPCACGHFD